MPFVRIQAKGGRSPQQKEKLAQAIIELMEEQGFAKREVIKIIFEDMAPQDYYEGADYK